MSSRPYTIILIDGTVTVVENIDAPLGKQAAYDYASKAYPDKQILALIPGTHANHSYTYNSGFGGTAGSAMSNIDLFDTSYISEKKV